MTDLTAKAEALRDLHQSRDLLILPNAWDVASAKLFEEVGFPAIATTSGGVAATLGYPDGERIPAKEMLQAVERIASAVTVPVTADLEGGYGLPAQELVDALLGAGAVGLNIEDSNHHGQPALADPDAQASRLREIREAAGRSGVDVVLNARVDVDLRESSAKGIEEAAFRGQRYLDAGADCVFPISATDDATIAALVKAVSGPINVYVRRGSPSLVRLRELGVARVTFGGGIMRAGLAQIRVVAEELKAGRAERLTSR